MFILDGNRAEDSGDFEAESVHANFALLTETFHPTEDLLAVLHVFFDEHQFVGFLQAQTDACAAFSDE